MDSVELDTLEAPASTAQDTALSEQEPSAASKSPTETDIPLNASDGPELSPTVAMQGVDTELDSTADNVSPGSTDQSQVNDATGASEEKTENGSATRETKSEVDDLEKLREAARKRRMRRIASHTAAAPDAEETKPKGEGTADPMELEKLRAELSAAQVEMASMRRNHVANVQKLTKERDMFALQLSKEQEKVSPDSLRGIEELRNELSSSKRRVQNLEEDNARMRTELKELRLRVQAHKTLDAANDGYEEVLNNLIDVKLQFATLSEQKENLVYENRTLKSDNESLSTANGMLEKSRSEWVTKYSELEKKLGEEGAEVGLPHAPERAALVGSTRAEKSLSLNSEQLDQVSLG